MKTKIKTFIGKWSIIEMAAWDQEYVNMEVPGHFTFKKDGTGDFQFGLVQGGDGLPVGNRQREGAGRIFIHPGEDSEFRAMQS